MMLTNVPDSLHFCGRDGLAGDFVRPETQPEARSVRPGVSPCPELVTGG
jgi:hypothetical protein